MGATKYVIFLQTKNAYFVGHKYNDEGDLKSPTVTYEVEQAKMYSSMKGATNACVELFNEEPHIVTAELKLTPVGMSEMITRSSIRAASEAREATKKERLLTKMSEESKKALAAWDKEQGISGL